MPSSTSDLRVAINDEISYLQVLVTRYSKLRIAIQQRHYGDILRKEGSRFLVFHCHPEIRGICPIESRFFLSSER